MNTKDFAKQYLHGLMAVFEDLNLDCFEAIVSSLLDAYHNQAAIFVMGNGGSAATASHFATDINKGCCWDLDKKFKMICLNDNISTLMAWANDMTYDAVFVQQMKNFFTQGDLVIGISGSGNSENVLNAIRYAKKNGGLTIGLSGFNGGNLAKLVDISLVTEAEDMQKVEDVHLIVVHMIMQALYRLLHDSAGTEFAQEHQNTSES
ncbi:MAG: SIS domain-containing protein [Deltaproteobacteria bacterium]|nr:SIS domain-containing protein [Deltaproteobacteria bacterium]MBW1960616.1 SIS domain-containing protein [Deltaproteobacteria bacterium]MBW1993193.1 SIS domain-containing protein [Deltaproteobacteria bacterium]MBW2151136.1 SIS domain-containing protein [Deltaproteobacteria bacterium]